MESKGHILHWSLNPLSLQGDWNVLGFEKILLQNLLGDIFLGRCIRSRLKKTWVLGGWGGSYLRRVFIERGYRDSQTGTYKGLAYNQPSTSHQVRDNAINIMPQILHECPSPCIRLD